MGIYYIRVNSDLDHRKLDSDHFSLFVMEITKISAFEDMADLSIIRSSFSYPLNGLSAKHTCGLCNVIISPERQVRSFPVFIPATEIRS